MVTCLLPATDQVGTHVRNLEAIKQPSRCAGLDALSIEETVGGRRRDMGEIRKSPAAQPFLQTQSFHQLRIEHHVALIIVVARIAHAES